MSLIAVFKDREVIPIRAIPFVTGWTMSPDMVATALANTGLWLKLKDLTAYHIIVNGEHAPMLPKEWDSIEAELQILSAKLKANEINQESYPQWRRKSIPILPARCFVWKDEFEKTFNQTHSPQKLTILEERRDDRELNFSPRVPDELMDIVMEGFLPRDLGRNLNAQVMDSTGTKAIGRRKQQLTTILAAISTFGLIR